MSETRALLKQQYPDLYAKLSKILFDHDPIGLNAGDNPEEYEPEVDTILPRVLEAKSTEEMLDIVHEELVRWFDDDFAGPKTRPVYQQMAEAVWGACHPSL